MGQLEKYGLYVLCLVIFLILGVTIWGGSDAPSPGQKTPSVAINANRNGSTANRPNEAANRGVQPASVLAGAAGNGGPTGGNNFLESLLQPAQRPAKSRTSGGNPADGGRKLVGNPTDANSKTEPRPPEQATATTGNGNTGNGQVAAKAPAFRIYTVKSGDSFDSIARRQLGGASRRKEIATLNPSIDARRLKIGAKIKLPNDAASNNAASNAAATSGSDALQRAGAYRSYTIGKGDTFERIARVELGSIRRVADLKKLNPGVDPRKLRIGKKIKLPLK